MSESGSVAEPRGRQARRGQRPSCLGRRPGPAQPDAAEFWGESMFAGDGVGVCVCAVCLGRRVGRPLCWPVLAWLACARPPRACCRSHIVGEGQSKCWRGGSNKSATGAAGAAGAPLTPPTPPGVVAPTRFFDRCGGGALCAVQPSSNPGGAVPPAAITAAGL